MSENWNKQKNVKCVSVLETWGITNLRGPRDQQTISMIKASYHSLVKQCRQKDALVHGMYQILYQSKVLRYHAKNYSQHDDIDK